MWNSSLKSLTRLKLITIPDKHLMFLWNNVYGFLGTNYCIHKRYSMGPLQLGLPPLAQTSSYATACHASVMSLTRCISNMNSHKFF